MLQKLVLRLQQLCQLEALLDEALAHAPHSFAIPTTSGILTPFANPQTSRVRCPVPKVGFHNTSMTCQAHSSISTM